MSERQHLPLLLFTSPVELTTCVDSIRYRSNIPFRAERIGIGPSNARRSTAYILDNADPPSAVFTLGSAQWLSRSHMPHLPVWAREVKRRGRATLRPTLKVKQDLFEGMAWHSARLVTVDRPICDMESALELGESAQVELADTESYSILELSMERELPCAVIRVASSRPNPNRFDVYRDSAPEKFEQLGLGLAELLDWLTLQEEQRLSRNLK